MGTSNPPSNGSLYINTVIATLAVDGWAVTTFIPVRLHNIWVTVSPRSLHPGTGTTDSDRVTQLTTYCREHAPSLANVVSTTPVLPPGTLCHLTYMTLLTLTHSRNDLKLFCLIVRTAYWLLLYGAPGRFVERRLTDLSLYCRPIVLYCTFCTARRVLGGAPARPGRSSLYQM